MTKICHPCCITQLEEIVRIALYEATHNPSGPHAVSIYLEGLQPVHASVTYLIGETGELDEREDFFAVGDSAFGYPLPETVVDHAHELAHKALENIDRLIGCADLTNGEAIIHIDRFGPRLAGAILIQNGEHHRFDIE